MQVLAHHGPNWTSEALDVSEDGDVVAVAVGRTVMLYSSYGACNAELRATGYGGIVSVSSCQSRGLTHLLAVLTNECVLRVFDVASRRMVRNVCDGRNSLTDRPKEGPFAVRFFPNAPHIIFLLFVTGRWHLLQINTPQTSVLSKGDLPLHTVSSLTSDNSQLYVSGECKNESAVLVISLSSKCDERSTAVFVHTRKITSPFLADDISVRADGSHLAMMSTMLTTPFIDKLLDDGVGLHNHTAGAPELRGGTRKGIRTCVAWTDREYLVSSDARGSLTLWHVDNKDSAVRKVACRPRAHVRQVVCIRIVRTRGSNGRVKPFPFILSASADRTVAMWRLSGMNEDATSFKLMWRSMRTTGVVAELSLKQCKVEHGRPDIDLDHAKESILTFATSDGTVTSLFLPSELPVADENYCSAHIPYVLSELLVATANGGKLGKRTRGSKNRRDRAGRGNGKEDKGALTSGNDNAIAGLANSIDAMVLTQFLTGDGNLGVVRQTSDGRVTYSACKRARGDGSNKGTHGLEQDRGLETMTTDTGFLDFCNGHLSSLAVVESERKDGTKKWEVSERFVASIASLQSKGVMTAIAAHPSLELYLVTGCDGCVWQCSSQCDPQLLYSRSSATGTFTSAAVASDGAVALGTSHGEVMVSASGACRFRKTESERCDWKEEINWQLAGMEKASVVRLRWSCDSRMIVVILGNGEISIWDRTEGGEGGASNVMSEITRIKAQLGGVKDAVWTSLHTLVTGGADGSVRMWDVTRLPKSSEENGARALKI